MKIHYTLIAIFLTYSSHAMDHSGVVQFIPCGEFYHNTPVFNAIDTDTVAMPYTYLPSTLFKTDYSEKEVAPQKINATLTPENFFTIVAPGTFGITLPLMPCNGLVITNAKTIDGKTNPKTILAHVTYRTNIEKMIRQLSKIYADIDPASLSVLLYSNKPKAWNKWRPLIYAQILNDFNPYYTQLIAQIAPNDSQQIAAIPTDPIFKIWSSFSPGTFRQQDGMAYLAHRISKALAIPEKNITVDLIKTDNLARIRDTLINLFRLPEEMVYIENDTLTFNHHHIDSFTKQEISHAFDCVMNTFKAPLCLVVDHKGNCFNTSYDTENFHQSSILVDDDGSTKSLCQNSYSKDNRSKISLKDLHEAVTYTKNIAFTPGSSPLYEIQNTVTAQQ